MESALAGPCLGGEHFSPPVKVLLAGLNIEWTQSRLTKVKDKCCRYRGPWIWDLWNDPKTGRVGAVPTKPQYIEKKWWEADTTVWMLIPWRTKQSLFTESTQTLDSLSGKNGVFRSHGGGRGAFTEIYFWFQETERANVLALAIC